MKAHNQKDQAMMAEATMAEATMTEATMTEATMTEATMTERNDNKKMTLLAQAVSMACLISKGVADFFSLHCVVCDSFVFCVLCHCILSNFPRLFPAKVKSVVAPIVWTPDLK